MGDFTRYITKNGDRWDSIAWNAYGDVAKQKDIMDANPDVALFTSFGDGITLILPIIPEVNTQASLPAPWNQVPATVIVSETPVKNLADFTRYITKNGDRWDSIAWNAYGDVAKQKDIMDANPDVALFTSFGDGITLILPIIPEVNAQSSLLPLWKQDPETVILGTNILTIQSAKPTGPKATGDGSGDGFDYLLDLIITS